MPAESSRKYPKDLSLDEWPKEALRALENLRASFHQTHTHFRASGKLGECYVCGDWVNELIDRGKALFLDSKSATK